MSRWMRWQLVGVTGGAAVLRARGLFGNSFHADEALFASWARLIAVWRDPLLLSAAVDKPPLLFYLQALFFPLQGPVEWAARLPNWIAALLLAPLVGAVAWRLFRDEWTAVFAAAFIALSPLHIQFSATAFTDSLLATLLFAAWALGAGEQGSRGAGEQGSRGAGEQGSGGAEGRGNQGSVGGGEPQTPIPDPRSPNPDTRSPIPDPRSPIPDPRSLLAGLLFGLAVATKHQAWLFAPLVVGTAVLAGWGRRQWRGWLTGFLPVLGALLLWTAVRTGDGSLWLTQWQNVGGLRLAWSWELWPRLLAWLALWRWTLPGGGVLVAAAGVYWLLVVGNWVRERPFVALTGLFIPFYALLHYVLAVPVWDRYLLPLVPLLALLAGRGSGVLRAWGAGEQGSRGAGEQRGGGAEERRRTPIPDPRSPIPDPRSPIPAYCFLLTFFFLLLLLPAAWGARNGRYPIGGQPGADQGAAVVAAHLADAPYGTVLYDHWYSWQWRYHLFDRRVYVSWFPHPAALAADLQAFGRDGSPRFLALPQGPTAQPVLRAVRAAGFDLLPVANSGDSGMILYRIREP